VRALYSSQKATMLIWGSEHLRCN